MSEEEKLNPSDKMSIQTEYYLETLITDALKGNGFQKISELFENKVVWSSQKYSKVLLHQLDRLINKELDRNDFQNVSLSIKCIQHFCRSDCHDGWSLIKQGLVSKMVLWFERTLEFLKICKDSRSTISALVEDFYDTSLVICKCTSDGGIKQLLDQFIFTLGIIIMEKWPPYHLKLEALKTLNSILDQTLREEKKKLNSSEEMCTLMQGLARKLCEVGDYEIQVAITEALFRITTKKMRDKVAQKWFEDGLFAEAFTAITEEDFETDCRKCLNFLNSRLSDTIRVHSFPCISASTDIGELTKPQDDKLEHYWIDFNVCSQGISFYIQNNEGCLWESVRLQKESLSGYSLEECNGQKILSIHLKVPQSINQKEAKYVKMSFEVQHAIQNAAMKTYGADLQTNVHLTSPQQTDKAINLPDGCADCCEISSSGDQVSVSIVGDNCRVLEHIADKPPSEVLPARSEHLSKNLTPETKGPQSAKKKGYDIFEFKRSSESASDIEMSVINVISPMASSTRKTTTPSLLQSRSCQKTKARARMSGPANCLSDSELTPCVKTLRTPALQHAEDDKEGDSSASDASWILEPYRKSVTKALDYSRKRQKSKSKLKVLPMSSLSSDEGEKTQKKGESSEGKEIIKPNKQKGSKAKSLSLSGLNLPGVSAMLTPRPSLSQTLGTFHLSDLEEDTMDPLEDNSSDNILEVELQCDTASKMNVESHEDQIELVKDGDLKKRKRTSEDEPEIGLKPRKLYSSGNVTADLEEDVFHSDTADQTEFSFFSTYESFTESLKKTMMARYKKMEDRAQNVLASSHQHVSNLMNRIQQSSFRKLDNFNAIVAQEVSVLENKTLAFEKLEKETMDFWEAQNKKVNEFCANQRQRFEAVDRTIDESVNFLKEKKERKIVKESLKKL